MAWRPNHLLIEGELDNTINGKITGFMKFLGKDKPIAFDLKGNFHRDIRGSKIRFTNDEYLQEDINEAQKYMLNFSDIQKGKAGDITAGLPTGKDANGNLTYEYQNYGYVEWYSEMNGRCVIELETEQIELLSKPIPVCESFPIDRNEQDDNLTDFMNDLIDGFNEQAEE
jgi:hypothetical protein